MATSLVTGGAGFIGSHLVDRLVKRGDDVVVLDSLATGRLANLADAIATGRVTFIYADVGTSTAGIQSILDRAKIASRIDTIFHFASLISDGSADRSSLRSDEHGQGTSSLIEIALKRQSKFVFISESNMRVSDSNMGIVDSARAHDMRLDEAAVASAAELRGLDARIVRVFDSYGPRMQRSDANGADRCVAEFVTSVFERRPIRVAGEVDQICSLTYVSDVVDAILLVAKTRQPSVVPVNVGSDSEHRVGEIARTIAELTSADLTVDERPTKSRTWHVPELRRIRAMGWSPKTDLVTGLKETIAWYSVENEIFV